MRRALIFKGLFALLEIIGGIAVYWVSQHALLDLVQAITQAELAKDPRDLVANYLLHLAQNLSIGAQRFTASFLLSHGVVKLWLIIGLLRQKLWYYPLAAPSSAYSSSTNYTDTASPTLYGCLFSAR